MQIATVNIFSIHVFCQVAYCIQETGVETMGGGWLTCKVMILSLVHASRSKYYIQNLLLISGFEEFQNVMEEKSHDMRFFFVVIKCCSSTGFCLLTNPVGFFFSDR